MTTLPSVPFPFTFHGTVQDVSGVVSVQYRIDDGEFANVDNISGDWTVWEKKEVPLLEGEHNLTIEARDTHQTTQSLQFLISVRTPFEPTAIDQVFEPTTYLRELLGFASRQIMIAGATTGPTAQNFADRFFQPFDKLTVATNYEQAVHLVHQARIAVEVLRRQIQPAVPPVINRRFRSAAYQALLRELGTSHEELRLARVADAATRRALAARIGIEIEPPRPDRLDRITFLPDDITDAELETLFGYRSTTTADPLQPPRASPTFLVLNARNIERVCKHERADIRPSFPLLPNWEDDRNVWPSPPVCDHADAGTRGTVAAPEYLLHGPVRHRAAGPDCVVRVPSSRVVEYHSRATTGL